MYLEDLVKTCSKALNPKAYGGLYSDYIGRTCRDDLGLYRDDLARKLARNFINAPCLTGRYFL